MSEGGGQEGCGDRSWVVNWGPGSKSQVPSFIPTSQSHSLPKEPTPTFSSEFLGSRGDDPPLLAFSPPPGGPV